MNIGWELIIMELLEGLVSLKPKAKKRANRAIPSIPKKDRRMTSFTEGTGIFFLLIRKEGIKARVAIKKRRKEII